MNVDKLTTDLNKVSSERAATELDKMIALHEAEAARNKELVKRYLHNLATSPAALASYTLTNQVVAPVNSVVSHEAMAQYLKTLKKELE